MPCEVGENPQKQHYPPQRGNCFRKREANMQIVGTMLSIQLMRFEWDELKNRSNLEKHKVSF